jgi:murein DD-endopeptidase MepM/ murein hydrolase activator NlpD
MNTWKWGVTVVLAALCMAGASGQDASERYQKVVQRLVDAINAQDYPATRQDFAKVMLDALPPAKAEAVFKGLSAQYGKITKLGPAKLTPPNQAVIPAHFEKAVLDIRVVLDEQDKIVGLWFGPHAADIPVPEKHVTVLRLPFAGRWQVVWGGDTKELNQHHDTPNQQYAFDLLGVNEQGRTRKGDGTRNEDFYAFGREVLAPADGVVTEVIEGVRDNQPGSMNPYSALGNAVFIQHRQSEVSVLAHFKQGSIRVKAGDQVKTGQALGLCGNSGNSSEPHLHYHLQNTPIIQDATGIKCFFENVVLTRDGKSVPQGHYSPVKGDVVEPQAEGRK